MPASTSALWTTRVPERATGAEPPDMAIERIRQGTPALAAATMASEHSLGSFRGLTGQTPIIRIGRRRRASRPPTTAAAMSRITSVSHLESGPAQTCFVVLHTAAS